MKSISIELDKPRTLRLDWNAIAEFENVTGRSLMEVAYKGEFSFLIMRNLTWACLLHSIDEHTASPVMVGKIIQEHWTEKGKTTADLLDLLKSAIAECGLFGKRKHNEDDNKKKSSNRKKQQPS